MIPGVKGWLLDTHALLRMLHGGLFDRMLVCQAKRHGLGINSANDSLDPYGLRRIW